MYFDITELDFSGGAIEKSPQYYFKILGWDEDPWNKRKTPGFKVSEKPPESFYKSWAHLNASEKEAASGKYIGRSLLGRTY